MLKESTNSKHTAVAVVVVNLTFVKQTLQLFSIHILRVVDLKLFYDFCLCQLQIFCIVLYTHLLIQVANHLVECYDPHIDLLICQKTFLL